MLLDTVVVPVSFVALTDDKGRKVNISGLIVLRIYTRGVASKQSARTDLA